MKKEELKKAIRAKEKELEAKRNEMISSQNLEEVRSLKTDCDSIIEELQKLRDELEALENDDKENGDGGETGRSTSFNPMNAYGGKRNSFSMAGGVQVATTEKSALKRNESILSRFDFERKNLDLGKYIRGIATGNWDGATEERTAMTTSALGAIIPVELSGQIIDRARNKSLFVSAGVPVYPMKSNSLKIGRVATDPVFKFKAEGAEGEEASFDLEAVTLNAKTIYGYAYVTLEALQSAENLTDILMKVFSQAVADGIDKGLLYGQTGDVSGVAPSGIMNDTNINVIEATNRGYDDFIRAIGAVRKNNGEPSIMAINADTDEKLSLFHDDNFVYREAPASVQKLQQLITNQLNHDSESGENDAVIFDPESMVIGMQSNVVVRMITDSETCIKSGKVGFQIYAMLDGATVQPKHIAKITGYTGEEEETPTV